MQNKQQILDGLTDIFNAWQQLLSGLAEEQVHIPLEPSTWTIKDNVAHLWSWQQASVARMEAALEDRPPVYPAWWLQRLPDPNEDVDQTNALLYDLSKDKPWQQVYDDWKSQFAHYLVLAARIPEKDLLQPGRYPWMGKYAIADSATGSMEHHQEHYEGLVAWLKQHTGR